MAIPEDYQSPVAVLRPRGRPPRHPYDAYLARLSPSARMTMQGCLDRLAKLLAGDDLHDRTVATTGADTDWWNLTVPEVSILREKIVAQRWAPSTANKHLSALRQVIVASWELGLMSAEDKERLIRIHKVDGVRLPAGRAIGNHELDMLLAACDDGTRKGARDACAISILYATGMRRSEVAGLDLCNWSSVDRTFRVIGKRNKEREAPLAEDALPWLMQWLTVRKWAAGPLLCPVLKNGRIVIRRLSGQTLWDILAARGQMAGIEHPRPHDFRRTVIGDLLDAGVDLATVQKLAGHANPGTTSRYDRRGNRALRSAVDKLTMRQPQNGGGNTRVDEIISPSSPTLNSPWGRTQRHR